MTGGQQDADNPLPENGMGWRRLATFLFCGLLYALLWPALFKLPASDVLAFAQGVLFLMGLLLLYYFTGASAEEVTRLVGNLKLRLGRITKNEPDPAPPPQTAADSRVPAAPPPGDIQAG